MNAELKKAFAGFKINTCNTLNATGIDAVHTILPMIHGIAALLEMGFRRNSEGEAALEGANTELVAAALDGIGFLAATAMLHIEEL